MLPRWPWLFRPSSQMNFRNQPRCTPANRPKRKSHIIALQRMRYRHIVWQLAALTTVCVIGLFLFPTSVGPYSAVHGPVTALQAMRAAIRLRCMMSSSLIAFLLCQFFGGFAQSVQDATLALPGSRGRGSILRC